MKIDLTISNYRCFPDSSPIRLTLSPGFSSFVGSNNSGKSSIIRFFYEFRDLFGVFTDANTLASALRGNQIAFPRARSITDSQEYFCDLNSRDLTIELGFEHSAAAPKYKIKFTIQHGMNTVVATILPENGSALTPHPNTTIDNNVIRPGGDPNIAFVTNPFMEACRTLQSTLYIGPFRNIINVGTNDNYYDIQVGQSFVQTWKNTKTGDSRRLNQLAYRISDDISRIFEFDRLEINPAQNDQTLQVLINGKAYKLNEVGSGLAQFIIVLANAAFKSPTYILIDEPELNLHPSLQIDFLTALASYSTQGVLFSTHSIGLARSTSERCYATRRLTQGHSEMMPLEMLPRLSEFAGELSFAGYQELGFKKILLVEGPTDLRAIQQFLRQLKKEHKVMLLPLGGNTLINGTREIELQELKRVTSDLFAIIDSEKASASESLSKNRIEFVELCKRVRVHCCVLERRAIENYFSEAAIQRVTSDKYGALKPYEKLGDRNPCWSKSENWRIAREMTFAEIADTDLGRFLEAL